MGCAAGTFESRCRNPSCAYVPQTDGYCCPNCKKMHNESLVWDVKNNINTKSSNEDIKGHCRSPALPYQLCRVHIQGCWQDLGTEERKSFLYLALVRNDKELHCRRISGKEPIPRERTNFNICFDRGMVLVQDAKVGDHFGLKYQVGKRCRLVASGISVVMVKRDVEDLEHQTECQQVTAKVPTTGRCGNPICSYAAETNGFCCTECKQMKQQSSCGALRNLRVFEASEDFQCLPGVVALTSSVGMIHFHCWWRSENANSKLRLCLLRKKSEISSVLLCDDAPAEWQLLQKVFVASDHALLQEAQAGDELQVQYKVAGKLEVNQITITTCHGECHHAASSCRWPAPERKPPGGVRL